MHIRYNLAAIIANIMIVRNNYYVRYGKSLVNSDMINAQECAVLPLITAGIIIHKNDMFCRIPMVYIRSCPSEGMDANHRSTGIFPTITAVFLGLMILSAGCTVPGPSSAPSATVSPANVPGNGTAWKDIRLTDLQGKGNFSITSFAGKTVLISVVSDSCPPCIVLLGRQLNEIDRLPGVRDGTIAAVALDLDPPLGPGFIANYHDLFNFTGYSARSSPDMTNRLFDTYGLFVVESDAAPVILVCPDGHAQLLPAGVKNAEVLATSIQQEC